MQNKKKTHTGTRTLHQFNFACLLDVGSSSIWICYNKYANLFILFHKKKLLYLFTEYEVVRYLMVRNKKKGGKTMKVKIKNFLCFSSDLALQKKRKRKCTRNKKRERWDERGRWDAVFIYWPTKMLLTKRRHKKQKQTTKNSLEINFFQLAKFCVVKFWILCRLHWLTFQ